jgi:hypothetical protein
MYIWCSDATIHVRCLIRRVPVYHLSNVILPFFLIVSLSWLSLALVNDISSRLVTSLTMLLTSVTFKFVVASSLPNVSYTTLCDSYLNVGMLFQSFVACLAAFPSNDPNSTPYDPNSTPYVLSAAIGLLGMWLLIHPILWVVISRFRIRNGANKNNVSKRVSKHSDGANCITDFVCGKW